MIVKKLKSFLDENGVKYLIIHHSPAFTAQEVAQSAHISGNEIAKSVMVKVDDELAMVVLPASRMVDCSTVSKAAGGADVLLADEEDFEKRFPGCDLGAMPPFGNLYDLKVYLHPDLSEDEEIAFNAGSHTELVKLKYADYERLAGSSITMLPPEM
tara:strand:- start:2476 stop:2943 length:468 start_codon:yes stop_codon:yes gene_type:complete